MPHASKSSSTGRRAGSIFLIFFSMPPRMFRTSRLFSCEFSENFKSTFIMKHLWWLLLNVTKISGSLKGPLRYSLRFQPNEVAINLFTIDVDITTTDIHQNCVLEKETKNVEVSSEKEKLLEVLFVLLVFSYCSKWEIFLLKKVFRHCIPFIAPKYTTYVIIL